MRNYELMHHSEAHERDLLSGDLQIVPTNEAVLVSPSEVLGSDLYFDADGSRKHQRGNKASYKWHDWNKAISSGEFILVSRGIASGDWSSTDSLAFNGESLDAELMVLDCLSLPAAVTDEAIRLAENEREREARSKALPPCEFKDFYLSCKHSGVGGRNYRLHVDSGDQLLYAGGRGIVLQVLSEDEITVEFNTICNEKERSSCGDLDIKLEKMNGAVPVELRSRKIVASGEKFSVGIDCDGIKEPEGIREIIRRHILPDLKSMPYVEYEVSNARNMCSGCIGKFSPKVQVYPNCGWEGSLGLSLEMGFSSSKPFEGLDWKIENNLKWKDYAGNKEQDIKYAVKGPLGGVFDTAKMIVDELHKHSSESVMGKLKKQFQSITEDSDPMLKFGIKSNVTLSGQSRLEELSQDPCVGVVSKIGVAFNPLLEMEAQLDLVPALATLTPLGGVRTFYRNAVKRSMGNKEGPLNLHLYLTVGGSFSTSTGWEWNEKKRRWNADNEMISQKSGGGQDVVAGEIWFKVKGKAELKMKLWLVKAKVGARVGAKGALQNSKGIGFKFQQEIDYSGNNPVMTTKHFWTGIVFYYAVYWQISLDLFKSKEKVAEGAESGDDERGARGGESGGQKREHSSDGEKVESKNEYELVEAKVLKETKTELVREQLRYGQIVPYCNL